MNFTIKTTYRLGFSICFSLSILSILFVTISCATNQKQTIIAPHGVERKAKAGINTHAHKIEMRIREQYRQWQGTRHQLGGTGSNGIDCSGFVRVVYKEVFNIDLPRTTNAQVRQGRPVTFNELQPGDLVFFRPPSYPRHVGIFLSKSEFVHASKTKGVIISTIDADYWGKYYWTARRILPASQSQ